MKISLIGLGWFGLQLANSLKKNHDVIGTTRTFEKLALLEELGLETELLRFPSTPSKKMLSSDTIVINIPPFDSQLGWLQSWSWQPNSRIIFISSTSVYGDHFGEVSEETKPLPNTSNGQWLIEEEEWIKTFPSSTIVRFGGLIGPDRHPGRILSGRQNIEGGNLPVNLIHSVDAVGFIEFIIENNVLSETFNLVHPHHPTREEYYQSYCLTHELPLPQFLPSLNPGKIVSALKVMNVYCFKEKI